MSIESLVDRVAARLSFRRNHRAQIADLVESLWCRFRELSLVGNCPSDPTEARGFIRAYAAAVVRSELTGSAAAKRDEIADRVACQLVERFLAERPNRSMAACPARVAA